MANLEVPTENLLNAVVRLPAKEFERFFKNAKQIKQRETQLIAKLNEFNLSPEKEKLYRSLLKKFRAERIAPEENQTLIGLTEELETLRVEEVIKELNITPKNYG
jgi:hypothetical protein